jgi:hypothetical protein
MQKLSDTNLTSRDSRFGIRAIFTTYATEKTAKNSGRTAGSLAVLTFVEAPAAQDFRRERDVAR